MARDSVTNTTPEILIILQVVWAHREYLQICVFLILLALSVSVKVFLLVLCFVTWGKGHILMKLIQKEESANDSFQLSVFFFENYFLLLKKSLILFVYRSSYPWALISPCNW